MNISIILFAVAIAIASAALWMSMRRDTSLVDLSEFSKLNAELKALYRETVVEVAMPAVMNEVNAGWASLPAARRKQIMAAAKKAAGKSGGMARGYLRDLDDIGLFSMSRRER
jgi:hypothetical protein